MKFQNVRIKNQQAFKEKEKFHANYQSIKCNWVSQKQPRKSEENRAIASKLWEKNHFQSKILSPA